MIPQKEQLSQDQLALIYDAPVLVAILIAGADDNIDNLEKNQAVESAAFSYSSFSFDDELVKVYKKTNKDFPAKFKEYVSKLPKDAKSRNPVIAEKLGKLNDILPKFDHDFSQHYYQSLKFLARDVAKASGGFFDIGNISGKERKWLDLEMIKEP